MCLNHIDNKDYIVQLATSPELAQTNKERNMISIYTNVRLHPKQFFFI